jgi:hypothetical protein
VPPGWGLDERLTSLICTKKEVAKFKDVKTGWSTNLINSSKKGNRSKRAAFTMIMMIIFMEMKAWLTLMTHTIYMN